MPHRLSFRTQRARRTRCNAAAGWVVAVTVVGWVAVGWAGDWEEAVMAVGRAAAMAVAATEAATEAAMAAADWEAR